MTDPVAEGARQGLKDALKITFAVAVFGVLVLVLLVVAMPEKHKRCEYEYQGDVLVSTDCWVEWGDE